jgi:glycerophosphoryl diester phosphodiesterase
MTTARGVIRTFLQSRRRCGWDSRAPMAAPDPQSKSQPNVSILDWRSTSAVHSVPVRSDETSLRALRLLAGERPLVIGHRGYCAVAPENTLPSFERALAAGADLVELDYHHGKDDVPVVLHDDTLDRTTNARTKWQARRISVADKTAVEIRSLDAGGWFDAKFSGVRVPLLTEALDLICGGGRAAVIERKSGDANVLVRLLRERNRARWGERPCPLPTAQIAADKVVVISFDWRFLRDVHELEPGHVLGALGPPERLADGRKPSRLSKQLDARWLDGLADTGAAIVVWSWKVSKPAVQLAHERGLKVWIYTVNDPAPARRLLEMGVDGLITNKIPVIRMALAAKASR